jgi:hypothetical protein
MISYTKYIDAVTTKVISAPEGSVELCTLGSTTYVFIPEGETLSDDQPEQIADSIAEVTMTADLKRAIKAASPHCKLIAKRMVAKIREQYSQEDEIFYSRIRAGVADGSYEYRAGEADEVTDYDFHAEDCRQWGRDARAALGL